MSIEYIKKAIKSGVTPDELHKEFDNLVNEARMELVKEEAAAKAAEERKAKEREAYKNLEAAYSNYLDALGINGRRIEDLFKLWF